MRGAEWQRAIDAESWVAVGRGLMAAGASGGPSGEPGTLTGSRGGNALTDRPAV